MRPAQSTATKPRSVSVVVAVVVALVLAAVAAVVSTSRSAGGDELAVSYDRDSQVLDFRAETFTGEAVDSAELRGKPLVLKRLTALPHQDAFWFAWAAFQPETALMK